MKTINKAKRLPGIGRSTFSLVFKEDWWKLESLTISETYMVKIVQIYPFTWWKKILFKLGFPFCHFDCILIHEDNE